MNLDDDESLLSGYFDDELDPADRLVVEWAVESSPPLAEDLRSLAAARDAVSSLPRSPAPRDLAGSVVANLRAAQRRARRRTLARPIQWIGGSAAVLGIAASLLLALIVLHRVTHETADPAPTIAFRKTPETLVDRTHPAIQDTPVEASPKATVERPSLANVITKPSRRPASPPRPDDARDRAARGQVASLMDHPRVIRALIVTDVLDASDQVQALIQQDARKVPEFGRITICQGIVVDPDRPDQADVFPVVLDEPGSGPFLDRLARRFPGLVVDRDANPEFLTQLPEVGQVALFQGVKAAPLVEPPRELAELINANRGHHPINQFDSALVRLPVEGEGDDAGDPAAPPFDPPGPLPRPGLGSVGLARPADSGRPGEPKRGEPGGRKDNAVTILVWVTRPTAHGSMEGRRP